MAKSEVSLEQLRLRIHEYCEWMGQRSFIYPNWLDSREEFLNENWGLYLDFTLAALGNPFSAETDDLERVLLSYQHHSFLNSLKRTFTGLISQEFAGNEKIIWTGVLEDLGEKAVKSTGNPGRRASTHYLLLTEESLLIKSSNHPLTQKFPILGLELEPHFNQGITITEPIFLPDRDDLRREAFSCKGNINGQDVAAPIYDSNLNPAVQHYSENFMKMISAFAVAAHLSEIKEELLEPQDPD